MKPEWKVQAELELSKHPLTERLVHNRMLLVGSTAINGHGNDLDVVLVTSDLEEVAHYLDEAGWEMCSAAVYRGTAGEGWFSARLGDVNLIVSESSIADRWYIATEVCKAYVALVCRETTKAERVALHSVVFNA